MRIEIREAVPRDIDSVYSLMAAQYLADYGSVPRSRSEFAELWAKRDLDTTTQVLCDRTGQILAYVDWDAPPVEEAFFSFHFLLSEEENPVLADLIDAFESKCRQQDIKTLVGRITYNHPHAMRLFKEKGYENYLSFLIMEIQMQALPAAPEWAEGIRVRQFQLGQDEEATYEMDEGASKDKGYYSPLDFEKWKKRMNLGTESFDPSLWFLACAGMKLLAGRSIIILRKRMKVGLTTWG